MIKAIRMALAFATFAVVTSPALSAEGTISRAQFTTAILDREPVGKLNFIEPGSDKVFFFTELRNMDGATVTHRWSLNGEVMAEVEFKVRASRWRVYSSKTLLPEWRGEWTVDVVDGTGSVIESNTIGYAGAETSDPDMEESTDGSESGMMDSDEPESLDRGQSETMGSRQQ